ncbi:hypothetical protein ACFLUT_00455 [Chloroflexota bacterium]
MEKDSQPSGSVSDEQEEQLPTRSTGCCCGLDGPGGKARIVLMIVVLVATVALMARGFGG